VPLRLKARIGTAGLVAPGVASPILTAYGPTVFGADAKSATPVYGALTLTGYAPTIPAAIGEIAYTGTAMAGVLETEIQAGGKTLVMTLSNDVWIPS
jgi:hypothetical protein